MNGVRLLGYASFLCGIAGEILAIAFFSNSILGAALFAGSFASLAYGVYLFFAHSRHRLTFFQLGIACMFIGSLVDMFFKPDLKNLILDVICFIMAGALIALVVETTAKIQVAFAFLTILLGYVRIGNFIAIRGFTSFDEAFLFLIFAGIIIIIASRLVKTSAKVKKVKEKGVTAPVEEKEAAAKPPAVTDSDEEIISLQDVPELQPMIAKKKAGNVDEEPEEKHVVDEETEREVKVFKKNERCIVCNSILKGQAYVCPYCETKYCLRCANLLMKREETCWSCKNPLDFEQVQD